jgi:peroxin-1
MTNSVHGCEYRVHSVLYACSKKYHLVSGILVTGRSGSGKTSIVRAVAKSLQEDPRTFTCAHQTRIDTHCTHFPADIHYIDIARISEQPIPSVKAQFNFWFDKCAWHRPSILILDNLDKLLSAEVEVVSVF